jgi:hypothetical protein
VVRRLLFCRPPPAPGTIVERLVVGWSVCHWGSVVPLLVSRPWVIAFGCFARADEGRYVVRRALSLGTDFAARLLILIVMQNCITGGYFYHHDGNDGRPLNRLVGEERSLENKLATRNVLFISVAASGCRQAP